MSVSKVIICVYKTIFGEEYLKPMTEVSHRLLPMTRFVIYVLTCAVKVYICIHYIKQLLMVPVDICENI